MRLTPPPEWHKEFADRREAFIDSLRATVSGTEVISRAYDSASGYTKFSKWVDGELVRFDEGTMADAEAFLRHLIDQGHKVAFAVSRSGQVSKVCVSYDGDQMDWSPVWPDDLCIDVSKTSVPMTATWT